MPSRFRSAIWICPPVALPVVPRRIFRGYSCGLRPQASEITPRGAISPAERRCARCLSSSAVRGPLFRRQQHSEMCEASRKVVCVLLGSLPAWVARHRHLFHDVASFERWSVNGVEFFELRIDLSRSVNEFEYWRLLLPTSTI